MAVQQQQRRRHQPGCGQSPRQSDRSATAGAAAVVMAALALCGGLVEVSEAFLSPATGRLPLAAQTTSRATVAPVAASGSSSAAAGRRAGGICMSAGKTIEMYMPALSSTMEEGTIVQWLKEVGDKIEVGDPVMVVESDKADMDVESFEEGYLAAVLTEEGDSAKVGAAVALIVERYVRLSREAAMNRGHGGDISVELVV
ncbi:unnamed protein product [Ectocarpus sp. 13 AM-2016]